MRLPSVFRRTPFRLTLLFLALFATTLAAVAADQKMGAIAGKGQLKLVDGRDIVTELG